MRIIPTGTTGNPEGPTIESRLGRDFPQIYTPALGSTHSPIQCTTPRGGKAAGAWPWPITSYSTEVKKKCRTVILSPLRHVFSWQVIGCTLPCYLLQTLMTGSSAHLGKTVQENCMHEEHNSLGGGNACYHLKIFNFALLEVLAAALMKIHIRLISHPSTWQSHNRRRKSSCLPLYLKVT